MCCTWWTQAADTFHTTQQPVRWLQTSNNCYLVLLSQQSPPGGVSQFSRTTVSLKNISLYVLIQRGYVVFPKRALIVMNVQTETEADEGNSALQYWIICMSDFPSVLMYSVLKQLIVVFFPSVPHVILSFREFTNGLVFALCASYERQSLFSPVTFAMIAEMLLMNYSLSVCVLYTECVDAVLLSSLSGSWLHVCVRECGGRFKCSWFDEGALLFLPSFPLHRTFPGDGSDGEWDGVTPLIRPSLSSPWRPFRFKTLQRGRHCGSFLHLCHRSVSDCKDCIFIFLFLLACYWHWGLLQSGSNQVS